MRPWACLSLLAAATLVGCHHTPPPAPAEPPSAAPALPPPAPAPERSEAPQVSDYDRVKGLDIDAIERLGLLGEVHFEYDKYDLRDADRAVLTKNAEALKKYDFLTITVEGHCDDRGSIEYNLALGDKRAKVSFEYLVSLGVAANRMKTTSFGKEVPLCKESTEDCWARNRRDHFTVSGKTK
jgi:peptidoglycan-associated lipoprotein